MTIKYKNTIFICTIFCFFISTIIAQTKSIEFEHLSLEHGLSQSTVNCILKDSRGFLWIGTEDGLNRYDGYSFKSYKYDPDDSTSINNNSIFTILEDRNGDLWIGTWDGGLNRYNRKTETFTHYKHNPKNVKSISSNTIYSIFEDKSGTIWIGTWEGGLNKFDRNTNSFTHYKYDPDNPKSISDNTIYCIQEDHKQNLWIGTDGGGLNLFNPRTGSFTHFSNNINDINSLHNNTVLTLRFDRTQENILWIGTENGGIEKLNIESNKLIHLGNDQNNLNRISNFPVTSILDNDNEELWIGSDGGGLYIFSKSGKILNHLTNNPYDVQSLCNDGINCIFKSESDIIWIGTSGNGINKYAKNKRKFIHFKHLTGNTNSLSGNMIQAFLKDKKGKLWIGTWADGLNRYDEQKNLITHFKHDPYNKYSISSDIIITIFEDRSGIIWIGTWGGGLNQFDEKNNRFILFNYEFDYKQNLNSSDINAIYQDNSGIFWIGTSEEGLIRYDKKNNFFHHYKLSQKNQSSLESYRVNIIFEDSYGTMWLGIESYGLYTLSKEKNEIVKFPINASSKDIMCIYEDKSGILWIGTYGGGLNKFYNSENVFSHYLEKDGLPNNVVYGILEDDHGNLWLSTNKGLSKFNPETEKFRNYDIHDGLQNNEFNSGAYYKNINGEMYFGGINGYNLFHPDSIKDDSTIAYLSVLDLKINNTSILPQKKYKNRVILENSIAETEILEFYHTDNVITFEFAALHYASPQKNQHAYILEGFDAEWNYINTRRFATYTNLPAGKYTFKFKGSNHDGVWNNKAKSINIIMYPPYWETWWFRIISIVSIVVLLIVYYKYRTRKIRKYNLELQKIINDRDKAETALSTSEKNYQEIFNSSSDAIFLHDASTGKILEVNQTMLNMYGYDYGEVMDLTVEDVSSGEPPYTQADAGKWIKKANEEGQQIFEWIAKKKNGQLFWVEVALSNTKIHGENRVLAVVRNIDDRKKTEFELRKAQNYIHNILNSMPSAVIGVNEDCKVTHWNEEAEKITNVSKEKATGKKLEDVFPSLSKEIENIKKSIRSRSIIKDSKINDISENQAQYSDLTVYPLISNGVEGAVIRIDDVTERVRLEEMMIQSEKMLSVGGLAAGMAHEINNPLAGMLQNAQVILNRLTQKMKKNDEVAEECNTTFDAIQSFMEKRKIIEMLEAINITGKRASKIVENMLSFSRKSESRFSSHDIRKILDDTIELAASDYDLKKKFDFKKIKILKEYDDVPLVNCERSNIQQVFLNVLRNGAQAMMDAKNKKENPCFTFRVKQENEMLRIEIEDNGIGMENEVRRRAFEPFYTTKDVRDGTGLGLSVSYFIINEQHKGKMAVEPGDKIGTKVKIDLPSIRNQE